MEKTDNYEKITIPFMGKTTSKDIMANGRVVCDKEFAINGVFIRIKDIYSEKELTTYRCYIISGQLIDCVPLD